MPHKILSNHMCSTDVCDGVQTTVAPWPTSYVQLSLDLIVVLVPSLYFRKKADGLNSGLVHRSTRKAFFLRKGHLISSSPQGLLESLQSKIKPSGEAANQLSYCKVNGIHTFMWLIAATHQAVYVESGLTHKYHSVVFMLLGNVCFTSNRFVVSAILHSRCYEMFAVQ